MASESSHTRSATIKDIAKQLGLSHTTVSRALHDHAHTSEHTKALVRRTANELGYRPNVSAQIMRGAPSRLIGLVVPMIRTELYGTITTILAEKCRAENFHLVLSITEDDPDTELSQIRTLIDARAAGIAVTPSDEPRAATIALLRDIPTVQLNREFGGIQSDAVIFDDAAGTRAAAQHLISLGHRRIGYVGGRSTLSTGAARVGGYHAAHRDAKIDIDPGLVLQGQSIRKVGYESTVALLASDAPPTAIIFSSSQMTTAGLEAIHARGLRIPEDISVVGFSDPSWFHLVRPALTTIAMPVAAMADATASLLFARITEKRTPGKPGLAPPSTCRSRRNSSCEIRRRRRAVRGFASAGSRNLPGHPVMVGKTSRVAHHHSFKTDDGGLMPAYVKMPAATSAPAIVCVCTIFGVNESLIAAADRFAEAGFIAIAPDMFWRGDAGPLDWSNPDDEARAQARNTTFDVDRGLADIAAIQRAVSTWAEYNGKYAVAGWCFGGRFAFLSAARQKPSAIVSFHGSNIGRHLDEAGKITCPATLHSGDKDHVAPIEELYATRDALRHNPQAELTIYPGVGHNFTSPGRTTYNEAVAEASMARALEVLAPLH